MNKQQRNLRQQEMFSLIENWQKDSQDQLKFCKTQGISYSTFQYWLKKYRREQNNGFLPMEVTPDKELLIEIRYPNGVIIHLPALDVSVLKQLVNL